MILQLISQKNFNRILIKAFNYTQIYDVKNGKVVINNNSKLFKKICYIKNIWLFLKSISIRNVIKNVNLCKFRHSFFI